MTVSSGFAISLDGAKRENFSFSASPSSAASTSRRLQARSPLSWKPNRNFCGRYLAQRALVKCDVERHTNNYPDEVSSMSALEQLKTFSADRCTKERPCIMVNGIKFLTAPDKMREKLAIPEAEWRRAIGELCNLNHIEEAAVLSTCNRIEIYVAALSQLAGVKEVTEWMSERSGIPVSEICEHRFLLYNNDATRHLFEVSAGLDSLVPGESQILGQVKRVVKISQGVVGFGRNISGLFKHAISAGKRVRTKKNIDAGVVSDSSAAVDLAMMKLPESSHATARMLVIGAGKKGKGVIQRLVARGCMKMVVVSRSEEKVAAISEELKDVEIIYRPQTEVMTCAAEADVIFTSTASETPLFLRDHVKDLPPVGSEVGGLRLFVDVSDPGDVSSCVNSVDNVRVYNADDLKDVVAANKEKRLCEAEEARAIIAEESKQFEAWRDSLEAVPAIKKLRDYAEKIRVAELDNCLSKLHDDISEKQRRAVDDLSRGIVNKILHGPMQHLRSDVRDSRTLSAVNRMFSS